MIHPSTPQIDHDPAPATHASHPSAEMPPRDRLIRLPQVEKLTGCRKSTIYELMAAGRFPKNFRIHARLAVWSEMAVLRWVQARIAEAQQ